MRGTFQKFFPWVWLAILLLLASGYWMVFTAFSGFAGAGLHIHLMQGIGWVMIALFVWLFHGPWLAFKRAVDAEDWPRAGANLNAVRKIGVGSLPNSLPSPSSDPVAISRIGAASARTCQGKVSWDYDRTEII